MSVREQWVKGKLPDGPSINKAIDVAGSNPDALSHVHGVLLEAMSVTNVVNNPDSQKLLNSVQSLVQISAHRRHNNSDGKAFSSHTYEETTDANSQEIIAQEAAQGFAESEAAKHMIAVNFAISEGTDASPPEFLRGYMQDGQKLSDIDADKMDDLINGFFAENGIVSSNEADENGVKTTGLYGQGSDGGIKRDGKEQKVKADADKVRQLLAEKLSDYLAKADKGGLKIESKQLNHPKDTAAKKVSADKADAPTTTQSNDDMKIEPTIHDDGPDQTAGPSGGTGGA